jgi:hypothetical protein
MLFVWACCPFLKHERVNVGEMMLAAPACCGFFAWFVTGITLAVHTRWLWRWVVSEFVLLGLGLTVLALGMRQITAEPGPQSRAVLAWFFLLLQIHTWLNLVLAAAGCTIAAAGWVRYLRCRHLESS